MDLTIHRGHKANTPVLEVYAPDFPNLRGMIILQHGYTLRKEYCLAQASLMAQEGYLTVLPDAFQHGENQPSPQANLLQSVLAGSDNLNRLIDAYAQDERFPAGVVGYAGYSMGALIGYHYLSRPQVKIKAAALLIGTPDWSGLVGSQKAKEHFISKGLADEISWPQMQEMIRRHDPSQKPITPVPLIMLNGTEDPLIPLTGVQAYHAAQKKHYDCQNDFCLVTVPGQDHGDTWAMNQQALAWFDEYLK